MHAIKIAGLAFISLGGSGLVFIFYLAINFLLERIARDNLESSDALFFFFVLSFLFTFCGIILYIKPWEKKE